MGGHVRYFDTGISPAGFAAAVAGFAISLVRLSAFATIVASHADDGASFRDWPTV